MDCSFVVGRANAAQLLCVTSSVSRVRFPGLQRINFPSPQINSLRRFLVLVIVHVLVPVRWSFAMFSTGCNRAMTSYSVFESTH